MKAICVDDERRAVAYTVKQCQQLPGLDEVQGFTRASEALAWLERNPVDLALLDIDMPEMDGIALAARIKALCPDAAILFLTAYREFAFDAFSVHPSGYLLKPVSQEKLAAEVAHALDWRRARPSPGRGVVVRTFGNFEVLLDGRLLHFKRARSKELLAYLVDRQGAGVRRAQAFAALWEDAPYDAAMQKQLDVIIRSLRATLQEYGIDDIFELSRGVLRVHPDRFDCDLYRFLKGDAEAVNAYRGEYMSDYAWASITEAQISQSKYKE